MNFPRAAIISLCAALFGVAACKDTTGASADAPATPAPAATTPPAPQPDADKPVEDGADKPAQGEPTTPAPPTAAYVECAPDSRKGGMCTREYRPVCGKKADDARQTFANKCTACSDTAVVGYFEGACDVASPTK